MATCACGDEAGHKFQTFGQLMEEVLAGADARGSALVRPPSFLPHTLPDGHRRRMQPRSTVHSSSRVQS